MASAWSRDFLTRRIDRCYLIAAGAKVPEKRKAHLELARHYRRILGGTSAGVAFGPAAWLDFGPGETQGPRASS
jgi:hypothetical protein